MRRRERRAERVDSRGAQVLKLLQAHGILSWVISLGISLMEPRTVPCGPRVGNGKLRAPRLRRQGATAIVPATFPVSHLVLSIMVSAGLGALVGLIRQWSDQKMSPGGEADFGGVRTYTFWAILAASPPSSARTMPPRAAHRARPRGTSPHRIAFHERRQRASGQHHVCRVASDLSARSPVQWEYTRPPSSCRRPPPS